MRALIGRIAASACYWLPATLLVAVASNQLRLVETASLSPWSGCGFGMFSSIDSPGHRHLHAFVLNDDIRREVAWPRDMKETVLRATTLPTPQRLAALATELARLESGGPIRWDAIELQVWTVDYQPDGLSPSGRLVVKERFDLAPR